MSGISNKQNNFHEPLLNLLKNKASLHNFKTGQTIYYKEHLPYGLFFLIEGTVQINIKRGKISKINAPAIIGYNSFINMSEYTETAIAYSDCTVYFLSHAGYKEILSVNPTFDDWLIYY